MGERYDKAMAANAQLDAAFVELEEKYEALSSALEVLGRENDELRAGREGVPEAEAIAALREVRALCFSDKWRHKRAVTREGIMAILARVKLPTGSPRREAKS